MSLECQNTSYGIGHGQLLTLAPPPGGEGILPCSRKGEGRGEGLAMDSQHLRRRRIMKRDITSVVFVISFVSLLVLGLVSRVQAGECSNNSLKGTYGLSCEGTVVGVGPLAVIGVFSADGNGNGSEVETISFNGVITTGATFTVTYTVNADCTGSFVSTGFGSVFHNDFVIDDNKKEIRLTPTESGFVAVC